MARKATLLHRGYLYAQARAGALKILTLEAVQNASAKRMALAIAWRAGYLARMYDERHAAKNR